MNKVISIKASLPYPFDFLGKNTSLKAIQLKDEILYKEIPSSAKVPEPRKSNTQYQKRKTPSSRSLFLPEEEHFVTKLLTLMQHVQ